MHQFEPAEGASGPSGGKGILYVGAAARAVSRADWCAGKEIADVGREAAHGRETDRAAG